MDFSKLTNPDAWLGLATLLALGFAVYLAALSVFTLWRLRHPSRRTYAYAVARNIPGDPSEIATNPPAYTTWSLTTSAGDIEIWDTEADAPDGPTVIVSHGWGSARIDMLSRFDAIRPHAARVLFYDMRGHGDTKGPCSLGAKEPGDLAALVRHARADAPSLVLYGYSLGAEVTLKAAARLLAGTAPPAIAGVILESPYNCGITPAKAVLEASEFPRAVNLPVAMVLNSLRSGVHPLDRWRDLARFAVPIRDAGVPLRVIHGAADTISPIADGEAIAGAAGGTLTRVETAGHKDLYKDPRPEVAEALEAFFNALPT